MTAPACSRRSFWTPGAIGVRALLTLCFCMAANAGERNTGPVPRVDPATALQKPPRMRFVESITVVLRPAKAEEKTGIVVHGPEGMVSLASTKALLNYLKTVRQSSYLRNKDSLTVRADTRLEFKEVFDALQAGHRAGFKRVGLRRPEPPVR